MVSTWAQGWIQGGGWGDASPSTGLKIIKRKAQIHPCFVKIGQNCRKSCFILPHREFLDPLLLELLIAANKINKFFFSLKELLQQGITDIQAKILAIFLQSEIRRSIIEPITAIFKARYYVILSLRNFPCPSDPFGILIPFGI